jgi:hypothetical protein
MKRMGLLVALIVLGLCGCDRAAPATAPVPSRTSTAATPTASPSASASPGPSASASPGEAVEFSVDGAGPYQLGLTLTALTAEPGLDGVTTGTPGCPRNTLAHGTGTWAAVALYFRPDGVLYLTLNTSPAIPTPSGAWIGTSLAELRKIYAAIPGQDLSHGGAAGYLVTTLSGRGILFQLDVAKRVTSMRAGDAAFLKANFSTGAAYC